MKKIIIYIFLFLVVLLIFVYGLLFTQPGNNILKSSVEKKLSSLFKMPVIAEYFSLRPSHIKLNFKAGNALKINIDSDFSIFSKQINGKIISQVLDLSKLQHFTKAKLSGSFFINILFSGNIYKDIKLNLTSNIFNGDAKAKIILQNSTIKNILYNFKNIPIENILSFLNYKKYATGILDSYGNFDLSNFKGNGKTLFIGTFNHALIKKDFNIDLPYTKFKGEIIKQIKNNYLNIVGNIYSTLANIFIDKTSIDLKTGIINSHYNIIVNNLAILNNITKQNLNGKGNIDGILKFNKNIFTKGICSINKNKFTYILKYPDLKITSNNFNSIDMLKTLSYPAIFDTNAKVKLHYNLKSEKGNLHINFDRGVFKNTKIFNRVKQITGVDITLEIYRNGFLITDIDKKVFTTIFQLTSQKTKISSNHTIINLEKSLIDSLINFEVLGLPLKIFLNGDIKHPEIKTDLRDIIKNQFFNNVNQNKIDNKKINKLIQKKKKKINNFLNKFK